jgi:predicted acyl esterase
MIALAAAQTDLLLLSLQLGPCTRRCADLLLSGFHVVAQDWRGLGSSSGNFSFWRCSAGDMAATLAFLRRQVRCCAVP